MRKEDCFYLGKIVSRHGYKGDLLAKLDTDQPGEYENLESVFISLGNTLVPFFIRQSRLHKSELLRLSFEEVSGEDAATKLIGAELYLPLTQLPELSGNQFYYHEVIGFSLIDRQHGHVGEIKGVNDQSSQVLFIAEKDGKELLIPVSDPFLERVDRKAREIHINTPDGLIDLFLNP
ncbi:16S rRNA processing protein RimM [Robiginitalea myxolifaciens]|uniref:Ribosome maturation factor RimM n=1 Tax=Robiginitalea myxolifaciens TaxID=400055 RepID=A0A1I6FV35_9FLAO|nr:ribosome maturation factor RimM [Robiginitalea myxolifaciens]SFR33799.1 16S rRNA processing protein RimM [Robiginitalea myxolifaciens]